MAKRTYSTAQKTYMLAAANLKALETREEEIEIRYIAENGIKNPDGSTPERVYCIEDAAVFEKANSETSSIIDSSGLWAEILAARDLLKAAEENLINYGLNVVPVPAKEKAVLTEQAKTNYTTRLKIIELVMRLDPATVPAI